MHKFDRLQRLYALHGMLIDLAKHPEKEFDMLYWASTAEYIPAGDTPRRCNSKACALGSAGFEPFFRERGLVTLKSYLGLDVYLKRLGQKDLMNYSAAEMFFGITHKEALYLFDPDQYRIGDLHDPLAVARRVAKLIKKYS